MRDIRDPATWEEWKEKKSTYLVDHKSTGIFIDTGTHKFEIKFEKPVALPNYTISVTTK